MRFSDSHSVQGVLSQQPAVPQPSVAPLKHDILEVHGISSILGGKEAFMCMEMHTYTHFPTYDIHSGFYGGRTFLPQQSAWYWDVRHRSNGKHSMGKDASHP